jgi:hypothetical protein
MYWMSILARVPHLLPLAPPEPWLSFVSLADIPHSHVKQPNTGRFHQRAF